MPFGGDLCACEAITWAFEHSGLNFDQRPGSLSTFTAQSFRTVPVVSRPCVSRVCPGSPRCPWLRFGRVSFYRCVSGPVRACVLSVVEIWEVFLPGIHVPRGCTGSPRCLFTHYPAPPGVFLPVQWVYRKVPKLAPAFVRPRRARPRAANPAIGRAAKTWHARRAKWQSCPPMPR